MYVPEAQTAASRLAERYRVLLDIGRSLTGTLDHEDLYRAIYRETSRVLETSGFYISLYDAAHDSATIVFYADRGEAQRVEITYRGSDSEVIRTGEPALVHDRVAARSVLVLGDEEGEVTRSAVSAPLRHKGAVTGAISAQSYGANAYTEEDLELLQGIADVAAVAIENARHVSELERRGREAERIEEIGRALATSLDPQEVLGKVIDACLALTAADGAAVWLVDGVDRRARLAASGGSVELPPGAEWELSGFLGDRLLLERVPVVIQDLEAASEPVPESLQDLLRTGSGIAAPLVVGGDVGGILSAGSRHVRRFSDEDMRVLERLANQASLALGNARLHSSLQSLSLTDPLTGLANRRHLQIHVDKEVAAARRGRAIVAVIFDLDDFKKHNDTLGHLVGDEMLRAFARILAVENRAMNLVARYGGDEFVSILSDSRMEGARLYVTRVRESVAADPLLSRYGVTASAGLSAFERATMRTGDDLLKTADADLYRNKALRSRGAATGR